MIVYYLDDSAWVKRYCQETGTTWMQNFFAQNQAIACASLGLVEVMATLARKHKAGTINLSELLQTAQELEDDWQNLIQIQLTQEIMELAKELARDSALRGADSVHLAAALYLQKRLDQTVDQLILITSDHELSNTAQSAGLDVVDPEEEEQTSP